MWSQKTALIFIVAAVVPLCRPAAAQQLLFSDTFSLRQGQRPGSWTAVKAPTPRFWFVEDAQLASGPGEDLGADGYSFAIISVPGSEGWTDYSISTEFWMRSRNGRVVLVGRWQDERNHYEAYIQVYRDSRSAFIDVIQGGERRNLAYGVSGVGLDIPSIAAGAADRRHHMQLTFVGATIALYLDGKRLIQTTDDTFSRGTAGVGVQYCWVYFDNVVVEGAQFAGPTVPALRREIAQPGGAKQVYRLLMGTFDSEAEAKRFREELVGAGYLNVSVERAGEKWDVLAGAFMTDTEAQSERTFLEAQGVNVLAVVVRSAGTTQYLPVAKRRMPVPSKAYSLVVGRSAGRAQLEDLRRRLELDGFFGAQVRRDKQAFVLVLGSFRTPEDADKYRSLLQAAGYKVIEVVEEKPGAVAGPALVTPKGLAMALQQSDLWRTLTAEQRKQLLDLLGAQRVVGPDVTQLYRDLKKEIDRLRLETTKRLTEFDTTFEQRRAKQLKVAQLFTQVNQAVGAKQFDQARKLLAEVLKVDPTNTMVALVEQQIQLRERALGEEITRRLTEAEQRRLRETLALARDRAESFEKEKYYQNALLEYETILRLLEHYKLEPDRQRQVREKIDWLKTQIALKQSALDARFSRVEGSITGLTGSINELSNEQSDLAERHQETAKFLLILVVGLAVLCMLFLWIFFGVRRRSRLLLEQMRSLTLKPMMEISGAGAGAAAEIASQKRAAAEVSGGAPPVLERPTEAPSGPEAPSAPEPPPEEEKVTPEAEEQAPSPFEVEEEKPEPSVRGAGEEPEPSVSMREVEEPPEPAPTVVEEGPVGKVEVEPEAVGAGAEQEETALFGIEEEQPPEKPPAGGLTAGEVEPEPEPLRLDELVVEGEEKEAEAAPEVPPVEGETAPLDLDLMGVGVEESEQPPAPSITTGVFYEQTFDEEPVGQMPKNWQGAEESYDFASLVVADETPAPGSQRYLRFDKKEGVGSAYYSCRFPDATGEVSIEFDIRCDKKNKFLLGFYIEKDGDFRQSIHTIIHQPDVEGAASLRIQGEAVPYEMGAWRHVKYVVNLSNGRLSGYVDGQTVLDNIRLANCPRSLNTLSIRDNIPTTGVLLIDNIRITRA